MCWWRKTAHTYNKSQSGTWWRSTAEKRCSSITVLTVSCSYFVSREKSDTTVETGDTFSLIRGASETASSPHVKEGDEKKNTTYNSWESCQLENYDSTLLHRKHVDSVECLYGAKSGSRFLSILKMKLKLQVLICKIKKLWKRCWIKTTKKVGDLLFILYSRGQRATLTYQ